LLKTAEPFASAGATAALVLSDTDFPSLERACCDGSVKKDGDEERTEAMDGARVGDEAREDAGEEFVSAATSRIMAELGAAEASSRLCSAALQMTKIIILIS
jgi:hypothetical protein